jgi:predicted GTPase
MYSLEGPDFKLTLVDTPGLGDTRDIEGDKESIRSIIAGVQALTEINAVCLVHKGTENRSDSTLGYYIQEIRGMLTKDLKDNFVVLFTHVQNP